MSRTPQLDGSGRCQHRPVGRAPRSRSIGYPRAHRRPSTDAATLDHGPGPHTRTAVDRGRRARPPRRPLLRPTSCGPASRAASTPTCGTRSAPTGRPGPSACPRRPGRRRSLPPRPGADQRAARRLPGAGALHRGAVASRALAAVGRSRAASPRRPDGRPATVATVALRPAVDGTARLVPARSHRRGRRWPWTGTTWWSSASATATGRRRQPRIVAPGRPVGAGSGPHRARHAGRRPGRPMARRRTSGGC